MNIGELLEVVQKCAEIAEEVGGSDTRNGIVEALLTAALRDQDPVSFRITISTFEKK
jgi:hypothetical protein